MNQSFFSSFTFLFSSLLLSPLSILALCRRRRRRRRVFYFYCNAIVSVIPFIVFTSIYGFVCVFCTREISAQCFLLLFLFMELFSRKPIRRTITIGAHDMWDTRTDKISSVDLIVFFFFVVVVVVFSRFWYSMLFYFSFSHIRVTMGVSALGCVFDIYTLIHDRPMFFCVRRNDEKFRLRKFRWWFFRLFRCLSMPTMQPFVRKAFTRLMRIVDTQHQQRCTNTKRMCTSAVQQFTLLRVLGKLSYSPATTAAVAVATERLLSEFSRVTVIHTFNAQCPDDGSGWRNAALTALRILTWQPVACLQSLNFALSCSRVYVFVSVLQFLLWANRTIFISIRHSTIDLMPLGVIEMKMNGGIRWMAGWCVHWGE